GARRHSRWQTAPPRFRRHQRAGLGGRPRLRRQGAGLRRARRMKLALAEEALAAAQSGRPAALATDLRTGRQSLIEGTERKGDLPLGESLATAVATALRDDGSGTV